MHNRNKFKWKNVKQKENILFFIQFVISRKPNWKRPLAYLVNLTMFVGFILLKP